MQKSADQQGISDNRELATDRARPAFGQRLYRTLVFAMKLVVPIAVILGGIGTFTYLKATKPEVPSRPQREVVWNISTIEAVFTNERPQLRLFGETVAGREVELRSLVAGEVVETSDDLKNGAEVAAGKPLLRIDGFDFEGALTQAKSQVNEAQARLSELQASLKLDRDALQRDREQLELAERDLERAEPLARRRTVTEKTVDDRRIVVTQRRQAVEQRQNSLNVTAARIAQQEAVLPRLEWGVRQAERHLAETVLKAPFTAYVTDVSAEVGRMLNANDRVATLIDANRIDVRFTLTNGQYGRILANDGSITGREVTVLWTIGDRPISYPATIERIGARITANTGGVEVYARLANPTTPVAIRPGAFVEINLADRTYSDVARLPDRSIYNGDTVYAVVDGKLSRRKVEIIGEVGDEVFVRGEIKPGERIMRTRLSTPDDGLRVRDIATGENS